MASALTDKLSRLVKHISGQARITESNVADMLREVRMALLEADVALPVGATSSRVSKKKPWVKKSSARCSPAKPWWPSSTKSWRPPWARA